MKKVHENSKKESFETSIIIASSIIVLVAIISFISYVAIGNLKTTNVNSPQQNNQKTNATIMNDCLEQNVMDYECSLVFWRYSSVENCDKMPTKEKRDECFYKAASVNMKSEFCFKIKNEERREECFQNSNTVLYIDDVSMDEEPI